MYQSKLEKKCSFEEVNIPLELKQISIDAEWIEDEIRQLEEKNLAIMEVQDGISKGDIVTIRMMSESSGKEKISQISTGRGYFDAKLEKELLGMKKGNCKVIEKDGEQTKVYIEQIKRRVIPMIQDEMVKKEQIEGVNNVSAYQEYIFNKLVKEKKEEQLEQIVDVAIEEMIAHSEFSLVQDEVDKFYKELKTMIGEIATGYEMTFEEAVMEAADMILGTEVDGDVEEFLENWSVSKLKKILLGEEIGKTKNIILDENTFERFLKARAKKEEMSYEELKEISPISDYLEEKYMGIWRRELKKFYRENIEFKVEPIRE